MFSFKYAIFCMLAGLLAGWSFDKKNNLPILGIGAYIFVINAFSLNFNYDQSWAFLAFVEMLAGHGLYKMGFGNFLGEIFFETKDSQSTNKQSNVKATNNQSRDTRSSSDNSKDFTPGDVAGLIEILHPNLNQTPVERCKNVLKEKGYKLIETPPNFIVMKQNGINTLLKSTDINKVLHWSASAPNNILRKNPTALRKSSKEDEDHFKSMHIDDFDDSY